MCIPNTACWTAPAGFRNWSREPRHWDRRPLRSPITATCTERWSSIRNVKNRVYSLSSDARCMWRRAPGLIRCTASTILPAHLVLLCKNETGYKNLIRMVSAAYLEGFYTKPRIDHALLEEYHEGLICLSACLAGEIPRELKDGAKERAYEIARYYQALFGEDFYLELQDHGIRDQQRILPHACETCGRFVHSDWLRPMTCTMWKRRTPKRRRFCFAFKPTPFTDKISSSNLKPRNFI